MENAYLIGINIKSLSDLNKIRYWRVFEDAKHGSGTRVIRNKWRNQ